MQKALVILTIAAFAAASLPKPGMRLLDFGSGHRKWFEPSAVEALARTRHLLPFVDVTDGAARKQLRNATAFPSAPTHQEEVKNFIEKIDISQPWATMTKLSSYKNRYYNSATGKEAAEWVVSRLGAISANRSGTSIEPFKHKWAQFSIVAKIEGSVHPERVVALSCHVDTVSGTAPGADDNGSGAALLIEVWRVLLSDPSFRPENSIHFMFFSGEEVGLLGSQEVAKAYAKDESITFLGLTNFDMVCYKCSRPAVGLVLTDTSKAMNAWTTVLLQEYTSLEIGDWDCGYGCSDYHSFADQGFDTVFPFECADGDMNPYIHSALDTLSNCDKAHMLEFIKLGVANVIELSHN